MAKPIAPTPELTEEDVRKLLDEMLEPPSEKHKKLVKEMKEQRFVSMF